MNDSTQLTDRTPGKQVVSSEEERAIQEVRASMMVAKQFPRDMIAASDRIMQSCTRLTLAENAMYAYPKGGTLVTGPSIRLAEAIAQHWGNIQFGIRELSQSKGESTVEAFAWDLETNTKQVKVFQVPHKRYKRTGSTALTDPRDIYEMVANQGARRLRACILGIVPGDVVEDAVRQCEVTLANKGGAPEEQIKGLVEAFKGIGVNKQMIEHRLGHRLDSVIAAEVINLRKIFASLRDGMASIADFFESPDKPTTAGESKSDQRVRPGDGVADLKEKLDKTTNDS